MPRKVLLSFVLSAFLLVGLGGLSHLHSHDAHDSVTSHDCQTCYLIGIAVVGLSLVLCAILRSDETSVSHIAALAQIPRSRRLRSTAAPRAPPSR
jgi:hypothetical protein